MSYSFPALSLLNNLITVSFPTASLPLFTLLTLSIPQLRLHFLSVPSFTKAFLEAFPCNSVPYCHCCSLSVPSDVSSESLLSAGHSEVNSWTTHLSNRISPGIQISLALLLLNLGTVITHSKTTYK